MKTARSEVKLHVRKCRAKQERIAIQARDDMFITKNEQCFNTYRWKTECRKFMVNGISITDDDGLWTYCFADLVQSQTSKSELDQDESDMTNIEATSHGFEDFILIALLRLKK